MNDTCYHTFVFVPSDTHYNFDLLCEKCNKRIVGAGDIVLYYHARKSLPEAYKYISGFEATQKYNQIEFSSHRLNDKITNQEFLFAKDWWKKGDKIVK